jgi:hypothetical protein
MLPRRWPFSLPHRNLPRRGRRRISPRPLTLRWGRAQGGGDSESWISLSSSAGGGRARNGMSNSSGFRQTVRTSGTSTTARLRLTDWHRPVMSPLSTAWLPGFLLPTPRGPLRRHVQGFEGRRLRRTGRQDYFAPVEGLRRPRATEDKPSSRLRLRHRRAMGYPSSTLRISAEGRRTNESESGEEFCGGYS